MAKTHIILAFALAVVLPERSFSSDVELTAHFQEAFSTGYCVPEVLDKANVEHSRCNEAWKSPISTCAKETGLFEFVTNSELSAEVWAARYEAEAYELTVCLFDVLGNGVNDPDNPDRVIYKAIIQYDDKLKEHEEAQLD